MAGSIICILGFFASHDNSKIIFSACFIVNIEHFSGFAILQHGEVLNLCLSSNSCICADCLVIGFNACLGFEVFGFLFRMIFLPFFNSC